MSHIYALRLDRPTSFPFRSLFISTSAELCAQLAGVLRELHNGAITRPRSPSLVKAIAKTRPDQTSLCVLGNRDLANEN